MISATTSSNYNGAAVGLSETPETKTTTAQATTSTAASSMSRSIELAAAATNPDTAQTPPSLAQMLDSVTTMLQNLMKMIQNLLVSSDSGNRPSSGVQTGNTGAPPEEPPTIIPVTAPNTTQQTSSTPPANNQTTQTGDTTTTKDTTTTPTREVRSKRRKGAKRGKSGKSTINGRGQFLWKPKSEKDGKLAILLPKQYTGNVTSVEVISPDGKQKLAEGKSSGVGNGDREHFRFNAPGESFPDGSIVLVTLRDGSKREVEIRDTSARFTR